MDNLRIIFFGTPEFVIPILETLHKNFNLVGVITTPDQPVGRKQKIMPSAIANTASSRKIPVLKPARFTGDATKFIQQLRPELFVVAAYGKIIPQNILDIPKLGALNIHPSLLPKYRGASPIQNAILNGDETSGVSIMKMDTEVDHGLLIFTKDIRLSSQDNFQILSTKMFSEAAGVLPKIILDFSLGKLAEIEQDHSKATFTKVIKKEDGYFDINNPPSPEKLDRMIRAFYPWPTAWTRWNGKVVKFYPEGLVQMEGKKPVALENFLNGYPDFPIKNL